MMWRVTVGPVGVSTESVVVEHERVGGAIADFMRRYERELKRKKFVIRVLVEEENAR